MGEEAGGQARIYPITDYRLPITHSPFPIPHSQLPITDYPFS
nr:hypothetical protein [Hassalia byssoidea]